MFYNMFLPNKVKDNAVSIFSLFYHLRVTKNLLSIIWRRSNKKFTLDTIREKNQ